MNDLGSNVQVAAVATHPVISSIGQIAPSLLISFIFFYIINFAILALYLKLVIKTKISWPALVGTVGASAAIAFVAIFVSFAVFNNLLFTFALTFVIMGVTDFALVKYLLKLPIKQNIGVSVALGVLANPILWLYILSL